MKLSDKVYYVGVQNPTLRVFDIIMETKYGTSYNSYLIKSEKSALVETVHEQYSDDYIENITEYEDIKNISYVVLNHTEPDHSGSLERILDINPDITVVGTTVAIKNLLQITNREFKYQAVKQGDELTLGEDCVLKFIIAPNLHWPDSMFTYLESDKTLFTCDLFGSHYCEPQILDTYIKDKKLYETERLNYYNAIFSPFKSFVIAGIEKIKDLDIELVCTSHGPVLKSLIKESIDAYLNWSKPEQQSAKKKAAVFYVSAYGYTAKIAEIIKNTLEENNISVSMFNMIDCDLNEAARSLNESDAVCFGSPTINRDALKPIWDLISCTEAVNVKNKPALIFGSYGWSGEAASMLEKRLSDIKYKVFNPVLTNVFKPSAEDENRYKKLTAEFANQI